MTVDGTFETGATGWTATHCTFAQSTDQAHLGTHSAKMTVSGANTATARVTTAYTATAGVVCELVMWVYSASAITNFSADIDWQTSDGTAISTDTFTLDIPAATWTQVVSQRTAPATTAQAVFGPTLTSGTDGQVIYIDGVLFANPAISVSEDTAWPSRITVTCTGINPGDTVTVYRVVGGQRTAIRGADTFTVTDVSAVLVDGEQPYGVSITYVLSINGTDAATSDAITSTLAGGKVALSDPITGLACETVITSWPDRTTTRAGTSMIVGGRTVFIAAPRGGATQPVEFLTETETARLNMISLLDGCTDGKILIRQPGGYDGIDGVYSVTSDTESRAAQNGLLERRLWTLDLDDADAWPSDVLTSGWTLADVQTAYTDLTLADLADDFDTLLDMETFNWGDLL